jgi:hypothetical protein
MTDRHWRRLSIALLVLLAGVMFATVLDYGMTGDEGVQHRYGRKLLRWYQTLGADPTARTEGDISMYGGVFEILAECAVEISPLDTYETRHVVTVFFALAAFVATWRMGAYLGGEAAGFLSLLFLVLTPPFYGHAFNNPKDIPFAGTFAAAAAAVLITSAHWPRPGWRRLLVVGFLLGFNAGVRVAGLVVFVAAAGLWAAMVWIREQGIDAKKRELARLAVVWLGVLVVGWLVMIAFWPPAWSDPLRHPFRAWGTFSQFWADAVLFFEGRFVLSGEVTRWYLPKWFALTMPETYLLALALGLWPAIRALRGPWDDARRTRALQFLWVTVLAVAPVGWIVLKRTPLYDGLRHFLFVMPFLAVLAGTAVAAYLKKRKGRADAWLALALVAASCAVTLRDMVQLHPYQTVYFNRLIGGGLRKAARAYETDYWCLTFKEGSQWLRQRYAAADCRDRIRVAGHSTQLQTSYYFRKTDPEERRFKSVGVSDSPHFVMATTRFGDHLQTPGRAVYIVERQRTPLMWLFEVQAPDCEGVPAPRP